MNHSYFEYKSVKTLSKQLTIVPVHYLPCSLYFAYACLNLPLLIFDLEAFLHYDSDILVTQSLTALISEF